MRTAVIAIIKDEREYLVDWVEWNSMMGIDEFFLAEDDGSVSHADLCGALPSVHLSNASEWGSGPRYKASATHQMTVIEAMRKKISPDFDWVFYIDVDEFLRVGEKWPGVKEFLEDYSRLHPDVMAIGMAERRMAASIRRIDGKLPYTHPDGAEMDSVKIRNRQKVAVSGRARIAMCNIHQYPGQHDTDGNEIVHPSGRMWGGMWYEHHKYKSWDEFKEMLQSRGDVWFGKQDAAQFFYCNLGLIGMKDELLEELRSDKLENLVWLDVREGVLFNGKKVGEQIFQMVDRVCAKYPKDVAREMVQMIADKA